jgi:glycosyltransferase involved in cell wall biosynthesis
VTSSLMTVKSFLIPHLLELSKYYDVTLVANVDDPQFAANFQIPVKLVHIPIERKIHLLKDLKALVRLSLFFWREGFQVVHSVAPKAGIVTMLAGWLVRVPRRLHVFQGEVWVTKKGLFRFVLKNIDRLMALLSTHLLVVSESERQFLIQNKIVDAAKATVLGSGSICGVDFNRFKPDQSAREEIRHKFGIKAEDIVLLYMGRLNSEKGILELFEAVKSLQQPNIQLLVVGSDEENMVPKLNSFNLDCVNFIPWTDFPERYMAASDILVLPSHREGFGLVIIEAAAVGITSVASRIYGISDAVVDGETGLLFEVGDEIDFEKKVQKLVADKKLRLDMGSMAYARCHKEFGQERVINAMLEYYSQIIVK